MAFDYDMIVIGGGAAGLTAAGMSALLGAKTALLERQRLGGDCTWAGCVPSKTLLRAAHAAHQMRTADRFGLLASEPRFDFATVMEHVRRTRQQIYDEADAPPNMEALGVEVVAGNARFSDAHTLEIEDDRGGVRRMTSRFFVIATGSRPRVPPFAVKPFTNETIFELSSQPGRLLIFGAGPSAMELGQAFARLGSEVAVLAADERILPRDDPEHAASLHDCLARDGITFHFGRRATALTRTASGLVAVLDDGRTLQCDAALAAMGREPLIEGLQLEKAGVRAEAKGILIDQHCRTSQRHIYAAGDVTGLYQFTHMAEHMSKVAVNNAVLRRNRTLDDGHVVWSTFTDPELGHLGESEAQLRARKAPYTVLRFSFEKLDRAITDGEALGEIKVFAGKAGEILGASILGARAGEMIAAYAVAMRNGVGLPQLAETILPYPTFLLGNRRIADQFVARQLDSPLLAILGRLLRYRGQRKGSGALSGRDN